jgi:pimeloyl-ACP methyl ester carboxylesterase
VTLGSGLRLNVGLAGAPASPPLVLLHGYPVSLRLWRHCVPDLAARFRVIAPDLPGHGESDKPDGVDYDLDFFVDALRELVDALHLPRFSLVVHDLGGMIGLGFAARYPSRLERLVVMDTAPFSNWPLLNRLVVAFARTRWGARSLASRSGFKRALRLLCVKDATLISDNVAEMYRSPWVASPEARRALRQVIAMPPERITVPRPDLARIKIPTLVLWAANDVVLPASIGRRLARELPDATLEIVPDCGHFLQEERPAEVTRHVLDFLPPTPRAKGDGSPTVAVATDW